MHNIFKSIIFLVLCTLLRFLNTQVLSRNNNTHSVLTFDYYIKENNIETEKYYLSQQCTADHDLWNTSSTLFN